MIIQISSLKLVKMGKFSYYVQVSYHCITISTQDITPKDFITIGLFDSSRLNTDPVNVGINYDIQEQVTEQLETWFKEGKIIIFNKASQYLRLPEIGNYTRFSYDEHYCVGYYDASRWIIACDNHNNLIIYNRFTYNPLIMQFGYIDSCQVSVARYCLNPTVARYSDTKEHLIFNICLKRLEDLVGDITITDVTRYKKLISDTVDKSVKVDIKVDKSVNSVDKDNELIKQVEQIQLDKVNDEKQLVKAKVENIADKYCQMAFEYYLDYAAELFSFESVLKKSQEKALEGLVYFDLPLSTNKIDISVVFNSDKLVNEDLGILIRQMYENLKNKLENCGFSVEKSYYSVIIKCVASRDLIDKLTKKYAC